MSEQAGREARLIVTDESHHAYVAIELIKRIPGFSGVNEAAPQPICYVATPAWASRLASSFLAKRPNVNGVFAWGEKNKLGQHVETGIPVDFFTAARETWFIYVWGDWYCCAARFLPAVAPGNRFAKPLGQPACQSCAPQASLAPRRK